MERIAIGQILKPQGLRGELKVAVLTDFPDRLEGLPELYVQGESEPRRVESWRFHGAFWVVKLSGCDNIDAAETLRNRQLEIPATETRPLSGDQHYLFEIIGLGVRTEEGRWLGKVAAITRSPAHDLWLVERSAGGELAVPAVAAVIRRVDLAAGEITVRLPEGLEEL